LAEWLVEEGIGEERAILLDDGEILATRLYWPGLLAAGQVEDAVLASRQKGSARGTVRFASGEEALVDRLPRYAVEGAPLRVEITREAIRERDRTKLAHARTSDAPPRPAPGLVEQLRDEGFTTRSVRRFASGDWDELWLEAWQGSTAFDGGELAFFDTSAMTLIDVDGPDDPRALALAAVPAIASALRRLDISGSIGIDFPTLTTKSDRKAVDMALGETLTDLPHERTAMNGFGFVQLVARFARLSLLQRIQRDRTGAAARLALRRAERVEGPGVTLLTVHPALKARLRPEWLADLERRTGRPTRIALDPGLALEAAAAQIVPHD
jgi:hypothetical protein